jgi:hypothetical protein
MLLKENTFKDMQDEVDQNRRIVKELRQKWLQSQEEVKDL